MSSDTSYRLRWPTRRSLGDCMTILSPCGNLPLSGAADFEDLMFESGNVAPGITIGGLVPADHLPGDLFWSLESGTLVFTAALPNRFYRHDDSDLNTVGEPSRESVLLGALERTCDAPDGHVVGAWNHEYLEHWMPMVWIGGRLMRGFVNGWSPDRIGAGHRAHSGALKVDLLEIDHPNRAVVIPYDAF